MEVPLYTSVQILTSEGLFRLFLLFVGVIGDAKVRKNADWNRCPEPTLPNGVANFDCSGNTCVAQCEAGKISLGAMKIKCKESKKKGLFWNKVSL